MIVTIAYLLGFQLAGIAFVSLTHLPVPGAVMGMVFFLLALILSPNLLKNTLPVVNVLLAHFALLFVPAAVGMVQYLDVLSQHWLALSAAIIASSFLAMLTTIVVMRAVMHWQARHD